MIRTSVRTILAIAGLSWALSVAPLMAQSAAPATAASATAAAPAATAKPSASKTNAPVAFVAPPEKGMVWVNTASGVYHTEGMKYYGKTKQGKYMTEADAQKAGYHAAKKSGKS
jgi:hypothetical protein